MKTLISTALLALSMNASAGELSHGTFSGKVDFETVTEMTSEIGEEQEAFLLRVARELHTFTEETGFEACGRLTMNAESRYAVTLTTNNSHVGCLVTMEAPEGYNYTPLHIHSHPHTRTVRLNKNDRVFLHNKMKANDRYNIGNGYSETDIETGAGYLVTHNALMYQYGRGTARVVAPL